MKINFFKKEKSFQKKSFLLNVNLYWNLIVLGVFLSSLVFFFFSYNLFINTNKEFTESTDLNLKTNLVTKERIDKTLNYFYEREQKSNQILYSFSPVIDPSL